MEIRFIENIEEKESICRTILTQLPEWFGLPDSSPCAAVSGFLRTQSGRAFRHAFNV